MTIASVRNSFVFFILVFAQLNLNI